MKQGKGFLLCIMFSIMVVAIFGFWSVSKHITRFGQAQLAGELPVGEMRDTLKELRERTASSLQEISRLAQEATRENSISMPSASPVQ